MTAPTVLISVPDGAEEIETITVADLLVRAGCQVTLAGLTSLRPTGSRGLPLRTDALLSECCDETWDAVYLPGGMPAAEAHRDSALVQDLITQRLEQQSWLAIICASPLALLPRGAANGRTLTSFPAIRQQMTAGGACWRDAPVVRDGSLLTSQGPGTAPVMGLVLAALLSDRDTAAEVAAAAIMPTHWSSAQAAL